MRLSKLLTALAVATVITSGVMAQIRVYVMSSGDAATDNAVLGALTAGGHSPTLGVQYTECDGSIDSCQLALRRAWYRNLRMGALPIQLCVFLSGFPDIPRFLQQLSYDQYGNFHTLR